MIKYVGYIILIVAFYAGYAFWHWGMIPLLAFIATLAFASDRRKSIKGSIHTQNSNAVLDGAFLFVLQCIIVFVVYNFGLFLKQSL